MTSLTVVFDLDGTLVDTAPDLIATLNLIFAEMDIPPLPYEQARPMIGGGVRPLIERGLGSKGLSIAPKDVDPIYARFLKHYGVHLADASRPFPGAIAALDALAGAGMRLAVCTNKLEWLSIKLLKELDLSSRFAAICGQDTFGLAKPHPELLRRTVQRAGGTLAATIMVGDSRADLELARGAGVPMIGVDFGYTDVPLSEMKPDRMIKHFDQLADAIDSLAAVQLNN